MKENGVLKRDEQIAVQLRSLYRSYGYLQYRMSKFEEYDFYAGNKDFLVSEGVITFTDTNGKLMALKPDVTLSIIRNARPQPGCVQKVCYQENVYRISSGTRTFKEIMQTGLECLGDVSIYDVCETVLLAAKSLQTITNRWSLALSHMGVLSGIMDRYGLPNGQRKQVISCLRRKNSQEISSLGLPNEAANTFTALCSLYAPLQEGIAQLERICPEEEAAIRELQAISTALEDFSDVFLDFSIVEDMKYYSGVTFNGFVEGLPGSVLSGGAYNNLMRKLKRTGCGIGFAVYLDQLERFGQPEKTYDVDTLLLYEDGENPANVAAAVRNLMAEGCSVLAQRTVPDHLYYRRLLRLNGKEVESLA